MKPTSDLSQYGNEKGISVQHLLFKMLDTIHTQLDTNNQNEAYAYNFKQHVASDIGIEQILPALINIHSQNYMDNIEQWTDDNKMRVNGQKSKLMIKACNFKPHRTGTFTGKTI